MEYDHEATGQASDHGCKNEDAKAGNINYGRSRCRGNLPGKLERIILTDRNGQ